MDMSVQKRIIAILTMRAAGDTAGEAQAFEEILADGVLLAAAFGSALRLAEDMIAIVADDRGISKEAAIRHVAVTIAGRED